MAHLIFKCLFPSYSFASLHKPKKIIEDSHRCQKFMTVIDTVPVRVYTNFVRVCLFRQHHFLLQWMNDLSCVRWVIHQLRYSPCVHGWIHSWIPSSELSCASEGRGGGRAPRLTCFGVIFHKNYRVTNNSSCSPPPLHIRSHVLHLCKFSRDQVLDLLVFEPLLSSSKSISHAWGV